MLVGLAQHLNKLGHVSCVVARDKRVGRAQIGAPGGSSNPVYVVLGLHRVVHINYILYIFDICLFISRNSCVVEKRKTII